MTSVPTSDRDVAHFFGKNFAWCKLILSIFCARPCLPVFWISLRMCSVAFALPSNAIACLKFPSRKARFRACPCSSAVLLSICTTSSVGELFSDLSGIDGGEAGMLKPVDVFIMDVICVSVPFEGSSEVPMKVFVLLNDPHVAARNKSAQISVL